MRGPPPSLSRCECIHPLERREVLDRRNSYGEARMDPFLNPSHRTGRYQPSPWLVRAGIVVVMLMMAIGGVAVLLSDRPVTTAKQTIAAGRHLLM